LSRSQTVARHLPFLRRYARALTGSQNSGDAYVTAVLEALFEEPGGLEADTDPRVDLYHTFTKIWNSVPLNGKPEPEHQGPAEMRIARLTPLPRQAFLLISLEGFSEEEAARVLDIENLVERLGHDVVGIARTHAEAIKLAGKSRPGLILADIQLADGSSGLDAVNELLKEFEAPVVFITAYPERFLTGERPEPAFLIPKPYQPATVSAVISQALFFERKAQRPPQRASA